MRICAERPLYYNHQLRWTLHILYMVHATYYMVRYYMVHAIFFSTLANVLGDRLVPWPDVRWFRKTAEIVFYPWSSMVQY